MELHVALTSPPMTARVSRESLASLIAKLVASGSATSKADLGRATGLARTTIDAGVDTLFELGAIRTAGLRTSPGRGRAAEILELAPQFGTVLVADCGATRARLGVYDLGQRAIGTRDIPLAIDRGPASVLSVLAENLHQILVGSELESAPRTLVVGLPGPVDYRHGALVRPPIMPGWDGFPVVAELSRLLGATTILENDANLRALGEARAATLFEGPLLYLKIGTGIGVGIIGSDDTLFRGADGAAGDVGHIRVNGSTAVCHCGSTGCLEAMASARAIGVELGLTDRPGSPVIDQLLERIRNRDLEAITLVRERSEHIGELVVSLIHSFNPRRVVVGGRLALASDAVLAGIRAIVYRRALPLATRNLTISLPSLGYESGLAGALAIGVETALEPAELSRRLSEHHSPSRPGAQRSEVAPGRSGARPPA